MSEIALKLIAENKKTRATFLDLGNCGLTKVPDEIGDLVWLEGLSFANEWWQDRQRHRSSNNGHRNNIVQLGSSFGQLKQLKKLYLNGQSGKPFELTDLSSLEMLSALKRLDVSYTQVTDLSPLAKLSCLQLLEVSDTQVTNLSSLAKLSGLQQLDASDTPIKDLSPLAKLSGLQELNISITQVTNLSPLTKLSCLQELNVSITQVTDLSSLANLSCLQQLDISYTQVTNLSPLANLADLQRLDVSNNHVTDLSPLAKLSSLQQLNVSYTQVTDLNPLSNLSGLQQLDISHTSVKDLSPLENLSGLQKLGASHTQVKNLSPLAKLSDLQQLYVSNTRITSLSSLPNFNALQMLDVSNTQVTDLSPLFPLIVKGLAVKWSAEIWKGNGIYVENCHRLNKPPESIVRQGRAAILNYFKEAQEQGLDHLYEAKLLLVGEGGAGKTSLLRRLYQPEMPLPQENESTKGIKIYRHEFEVEDSRYPEVRTFRLNVWDFGGQQIYHATHQFFLTQRSLYILLDDTRKDYKTVHDDGFKYWLEVIDLLSSHSPVLIFQNEKGGRSKQIDLMGIKGKFDNVKDCYRGNLEQSNAADRLRTAIEFYAQSLPHIGEELPKQWLKIRADIEALSQQQATISQQEYFNVYDAHLPSDRGKALHLSRCLHDLGVFLHFQDDVLLRRTVILQNQWATEAVFKILDDEEVKVRLGRFTMVDCERVWQDPEYADMHPELLALMQKFELCYRLPDVSPETWLLPQLLLPSKPAELAGWAKAGDLVLRFCYEFLPKGLVSRLIVRLHRFVPKSELAWLTGALFERDETQVLVEIPAKGAEIVLRARGLEHKELLSVIAADLEALNASFKGLPEKVIKLIPCCCEVCSKRTEPEFYNQKRLLQRKKDGRLNIECQSSYEYVSVLELLDGVHADKTPDWAYESHDRKAQGLTKIFISYSMHDISHKDTLIKHLAGLRDKVITWNDRDIFPGEDWDARIKEELNQADVVLYLVTADSMAAEYIQKIELPLIEGRCRNGDCKLIPVIVDFCRWERLDFAKYNVLPEKGIPVTDADRWVNENQAWLKVVEGIERIIQ